MIGFIIKRNLKYITIIVPYIYFDIKYLRKYIRQKKYYIKDTRKEFKKGDIIFFNMLNNKIYKIKHFN